MAALYAGDKLEKCNWCLENIIATADEPVDSRLVQYLLTDPTCDGGQWEMIVNIVEKYGVVPKNVYGECISSEMSVHLNTFLKSKLREFTEILRGMHADGVEIDEIREKKNEMMQIIHRIMIIHLGTPPTKFDFSVHDKEKSHVYFPDLTPQEFYAEHVDVSIVNDPRHDYNLTMTVDKLGNVVGGKRVFYINDPIEDP
ncbi:bleomycin hydrolase [Thraustotheca clavata]|uniref:Bleomycin hydrolase n=1 Tax=Thraustotheca clavata TaxID=74557 RepID=A0A1V9ZE63_9STRA|nr:bleomycin hydrolase [Thraustotheca clavata]